MKKHILWLTGLSILSSSLVWAAAPEISNIRVDAVMKQIEAQVKAQPDAGKLDKTKLKANIIQDLQTSEILKNEAFKLGLDKQPDIQANLLNVQAKFYAGAYINYLKSKAEVSDAQLREQYELMSSEINLLPIMFKSKTAAEAGLTKLKKGLSFEELMKQVNPQTPSQLWVNPQQLPPELTTWIMQLKNGQISAQPIEIEGQYYLLKRAGMRRMENAPAFETVKPQLLDQAKEMQVQHEVNQLLQQNGIHLPLN
ncbi:peptidylprolyl isomerase [Neisseriaceae bacterium ESL0693]|nr:peptidylprolyl isomerase [Neisseriaceae bacterium ESL0693]